MSSHSYNRVLSAFMAKPWAILPEKLAQLTEVIAIRVEGGKFTEDEIAERINAEAYAARNKTKMKSGGGVAVIPVYGVITPRADMFSEMSGGTSMQTFIAAINEATNDPNVASILLDIDSPGGQVDMVPEAAAAIRAARSKKPVTAVANTMAASAAYWLASQASEFVISPSAEVGSIGVFAAHTDMSKAMEAAGVKTTLISAGKYKTELSPYEPFSPEARAGVQETVNEYYAMFTKDVAAGRRASVSAVRGGFGEGRMLTAQKAVDANMADRIDTFESTLYRMVSQASKSGITGATSPNEIRADNDLQEIPGVTSHTTYIVNGTNTISTSSTGNAMVKFTEDLWPAAEEAQVPEEAAPSAASEEFGAESDRSDVGPQEQLAELRRQSRKSAISEREEYLSLLRRLTK